MQSTFETKDLNPKEVQKNQFIKSKLSNIYKLWGYEEVIPPKVERLETLMARGSISTNDIIKLVADEPIGLRPEMTASIARMSTTRLAHKKRPLRLWCSGTIFKSKYDSDGKFIVEENINSGVELIGKKGMAIELELLYLLLECLNNLQINQNEKPILLIGHSNLFSLITEKINEKHRKKIERILSEYDLIKLRDLEINKETKDNLIQILKTRGNPTEVIDILESIYGNKEIFEELKRLFTLIIPIAENHGVKIQLDPTFQSHFNLYTGLIFQLICKTSYTPKTIARGGRYDKLFQLFGENKTDEIGAGFSFSIDNIRKLSDINVISNEYSSKIYIAYGHNKRYEDAVNKQIEFHKSGNIAMVELQPCISKEEAEKLMKFHCFDKLIWLN